MLRQIARTILRPDSRPRHLTFTLPPKSTRFCTQDWQDDNFYFSSGIQEAARQVHLCGLGDASTFVDIGSGQGRLAIGLRAMFPRLKQYYGLDVHAPSVAWCKSHLARPNFSFIHVNTANERYNPLGGKDVRLPLPDGCADVVFLYSVFTHMRLPDIDAHLREISRIMTPAGKCFATVYAEDWRVSEEENPNGYLAELGEHIGALHRVVIAKIAFSSACERNGLAIRHLFYRSEPVTKQSSVILVKAA